MQVSKPVGYLLIIILSFILIYLGASIYQTATIGTESELDRATERINQLRNK